MNLSKDVLMYLFLDYDLNDMKKLSNDYNIYKIYDKDKNYKKYYQYIKRKIKQHAKKKSIIC